MINDIDVEVRTRSVPAAAHLYLKGFQPLGVRVNDDGSKTIRFSPAAREEMDRFMTAKTQIDQLLETVARPGGAK